jgi:hypothetical protein
MKRIVALAALMITMLAIPTAAMAGTTGSPPGPGTVSVAVGGPGPVPPGVVVACRLPKLLRGKHSRVQVTINGQVKVNGQGVPITIAQLFKRGKHGKPVSIRIFCGRRLVKPKPQPCLGQAITFSGAAGSSALTEVSGPTLTPPEQFTYDGNTYTIMSVNPGAGTFTVFLNNFLFKPGAAITTATGYLTCAS